MKKMVFESMVELEKFYGDEVIQDEVVTILKDNNSICADLTTKTKSLKVAINRFFKQLEGIEVFEGWKEVFLEQLESNGKIDNYEGTEDIKNGCWSYSYGIRDDEEFMYIYLNVAI